MANLPDPYQTFSARLNQAGIRASSLGRSIQCDTFADKLAGKLYQKNPVNRQRCVEAIASFLQKKVVYLYANTLAPSFQTGVLFPEYAELTLGNELHNVGAEQLGSIGGDFSRRVDSVVASLKVVPEGGPLQNLDALQALADQIYILNQWQNDYIASIISYLNLTELDPIVMDTGYYSVRNLGDFYTAYRPILPTGYTANVGNEIRNVIICSGADSIVWLENESQLPGQDGLEMALTIQGTGEATYRAVVAHSISGGGVSPDFNVTVSS